MADRALTTFGSPMSLAEDARLSELLSLGAWPSRIVTPVGLAPALERDLAVTSHRWRGAQRSAAGDYVPGDVLRLRALAGTWLLDLATRPWEDGKGRQRRRADASRELAIADLLHVSVPYFLPATAALGILASQPPDADLVVDLRLPYPAVAVWFSAPFGVPEELRGGEDTLLAKWMSDRTIRDVLTGSEPSPHDAPTHIRFATLAAYRGRPLSVVGVVLCGELDGTLSDLAVFVLEEPAAPDTRFHVVEGNLASSRLAPLVRNLAAAVAWGSWSPPERGLDLPEDPQSPAFRDAVRRGVFRRLEPRGAVGAVRVLDAARMARPRPDTERGEGHASPATHLRRGHWQRYRVGPRRDWRYEPRWVPPVVVNPSGEPSRTVAVYRLPLPPTT